MIQHPKKAVTLIELLICLVLMGMVIMGFYSIELFSHYHLLTSDRRAKLQNDSTYVLEHMVKKLSLAIGDSAHSTVTRYPTGRGIRIRLDTGTIPGTIDASDMFADYCLVDSELRFYTNTVSAAMPPASGTYQVLTDRVVPVSGLEFQGNIGTNHILTDNVLTVVLSLRWSPALTASADNPTVQMRTTVLMPAVSAS
ncbi:MAG: prepilin-type N-terminal cleavage/methylation domain-containing protein [Candidatus Omnitrophica bacterium]|jgi:prepilin-type N-terminal cleavage/methylation domain-containing protein|nr:prepilin-type N-terminal cleavage/methylation domain-containing protein [Candidatus Omnitrophota bacterium]MDD5078942.1 prepilin-type N-terminal cleavage/methylation domain-containing protein [Candidatus Omnitrophota bacterium]